LLDEPPEPPSPGTEASTSLLPPSPPEPLVRCPPSALQATKAMASRTRPTVDLSKQNRTVRPSAASLFMGVRNAYITAKPRPAFPRPNVPNALLPRDLLLLLVLGDALKVERPRTGGRFDRTAARILALEARIAFAQRAHNDVGDVVSTIFAT